MKCCHDLKCDMENKGEKLVITIEGDKEKIALVEKKLRAFKTLTSDCCDDCCDKEE